MTVIGHHYTVLVCPACREQLYYDADGNPDICGTCDYTGLGVEVPIFVTDVQVRLKLRALA